ncbi:amino acid adenylation domain protein [Catenulispora acidiphila DSM 44928]|uniref:Amino acid adenylation domain protein n=1 Tax=Catenulispora acidiphila (strain DSM 44928 / JCM 14897 / NBRC 102108 / NRRL B-24433 / ID139908) TaxID=479433 RepID=C7Q924_CATAD|nr:amino acid adenylation domain-containing protein [Catenulispora acidiphila]ACU72344.1 amino acid adenylation domain protein [Catenulispora acidiphila DSM 44928]
MSSSLRPAPSECVGPVAVPACPPDVLAACAEELARRLARRVRLIHGEHERVLPPPDAGPADAALLVSEDGRRLYVESMTDSADSPTALAWARAFQHLLACAMAAPELPMSAHPLLSEQERRRILYELNPHRVPQVLHRTMAEPFQEQATRTPEAVALVAASGEHVSYRELNERANRLAHFLRSTGAGPGSRVAICAERGVPQVVAIYAAVKAGCAYVPLDADLPDARLGYMLADCAPTHVLTDPASRSRVPEGGWRVIDLEADAAQWQEQPASDPPVAVSANPGTAILNILYTSGSTGRPKGVAYPTDGALAHLDWMQSQYPYEPGDAAVFKTSPGFDVSIWELFWPLYHGARLIVCEPGAHRDARRLARLVEEHGVTTVFLAPTVMTPFLEQVDASAARLRWALCGGEPVTARVRDTFYRALPDAVLVNCYGPTEAGTVTDMALDPDPGVPVPLGRPAAHFRLSVLGEDLEPLPVGVAGEAYISGPIGLAQSYWRAPARTAERFVADPYGPPGTRMYRTGDLCRYRDDGVLEHLGRIDRQVKIRGLRVEPGEVESVLAADPAVVDCAVAVHGTQGTHGTPARLIAFVVPAEPGTFGEAEAAEVLRRAAALLAEHMRPERLVAVPRIPATVNGKVDTAALLAVWEGFADGEERAIVPPADELEARLVGIYSRVLQSGPVSVLDTFAGLGGHSLLAFTVIDACVAELRVKPEVLKLLTGSVREVAQSIREGHAEPAEPAAPNPG